MFGTWPNNIRDNKKPNNPRPLYDHYIIAWCYMLVIRNSLSISFLNLSCQMETARQEIARHGRTFHSSQRYSQSHIKFNHSCVRSFALTSNVSGFSSCCRTESFWKSPRWQLRFFAGQDKKKINSKNKKSTSSSPLPLQLSITGWSKLGLLNLKMPPTFHFISCVDLELINRNDRSRIGQMEKNNNQINPHIKQGNKVYFL